MSIAAEIAREVDAGDLIRDPIQERLAEKLDDLAHNIETRKPKAENRSFWSRLTKPAQREKIQGLYIHGGVGRGKSMLMDLFFRNLSSTRKRRCHFHEFMLDVHKQLNTIRKSESGNKSDDPLNIVANNIADQTDILCFDEFHVVNIADAMILARLFETLFDAGTVLVTTSNWPPDKLYLNGLNRDRFLPFIDLLKANTDVEALDGENDYRMRQLASLKVWYSPLGEQTDNAMDEAFNNLTDHAPVTEASIMVGSRALPVKRAAAGVARFDFKELCEQPLAASDYLALTEQYRSIFVDGIPQLSHGMRNEARRLMTLVDVLYERKTILVVSSACKPDELYPSGDGAFEFQRTTSRLTEMQSYDYIEQCRSRNETDLPSNITAFALTTDLI